MNRSAPQGTLEGFEASLEGFDPLGDGKRGLAGGSQLPDRIGEAPRRRRRGLAGALPGRRAAAGNLVEQLAGTVAGLLGAAGGNGDRPLDRGPKRLGQPLRRGLAGLCDLLSIVLGHR